MNATKFGRPDWSTRGFTTIDPERQGVIASLVRTRPAPSLQPRGVPRADAVRDYRAAAPGRQAIATK